MIPSSEVGQTEHSFGTLDVVYDYDREVYYVLCEVKGYWKDNSTISASVESDGISIRYGSGGYSSGYDPVERAINFSTALRAVAVRADRIQTTQGWRDNG